MLNIMAWWIRQYLFVMGSSGHMVVWWPMVKFLLSTKPRSMSKQENNYIKKEYDFTPKSVCYVIYL